MASIELSIAEPCHENWNDMLPEEQGRFCLSCHKTVIDFTQMTDGQIFDYFKTYKGSTCGQFLPEQLARQITKPATHSIGRWKYFWQILIPAFFIFYKGEAQTLKGEIAPKTVCKTDSVKPKSIVLGKVALPSAHKVEPNYELRGTVLNDRKMPVPNATIISENGNHAVADSTGSFRIALQRGKKLTISSIGYEIKVLSYDSLVPGRIQRIEIDKASNTILLKANIQLKTSVSDTHEVIVMEYAALKRRTVTGLTSTVYRSMLFRKKSSPVEVQPQLTIFPNPIKAGQNFQINLQLKRTGNYLLQVIDATGKMVMNEKLAIPKTSCIETINGNALQQAGIYFLRVSGSANKQDKNLVGKIVVR